MKKKQICIVDYGVGNIKSIFNALNFFKNISLKISNNRNDIIESDALILPGVGAFASCIKNLKKNKVDIVLNEAVLDLKKPILGICVGMQLMAESSEENGFHEGLKWIPGKVLKINTNKLLKIPHVGWNNLNYTNNKILFNEKIKNKNFYFDHSYHFVADKENIIAETNYKSQLIAAVKKDNIVGVQFHPEKSSITGLSFFKNFLGMVS